MGPDHAHRRQPRHLHQDRLRPPRGGQLQGDVVAVPRLQRVHEGQGPARRALHHQPHLRHLRRQPRGLLLLRAADGLRRQAAAAGRVDRQPRRGRGVHLRPHHLPGQSGLRRLLRADGQGDQPGGLGQGAEHRRPGRGVARLQDDRGHHDVVQPVHGRDVPRGAAHEPDRARDDLPDGGAPRAPVHDLPGRGRDDGDADAADGLPQPAAALPGLHQEGRRDERRRLRLLLRGAAGLRGGRAPAGAAELLGRVQQPRLLHLRLQDDGRLGQRDVRHPGHRRRRRAGHDEPRRHQPRHPDPARLLLLRGLAGRRRGLRAQGPARQPGRQAPPVEPDDDAEAAEARPRRRQLLVGDEPALVRRAHRRQPGDGHRRRRAGAAVGDGAGQQGPHPARQRHRLAA